MVSRALTTACTRARLLAWQCQLQSMGKPACVANTGCLHADLPPPPGPRPRKPCPTRPAPPPPCSTLYKLLRCTCLHCFKFRMAGGEVERFRRRLQLLSQGRLVEAQNLVVGTSAAAKKTGGQGRGRWRGRHAARRVRCAASLLLLRSLHVVIGLQVLCAAVNAVQL